MNLISKFLNPQQYLFRTTTSRTKGTYLGANYRKLTSRMGKKKALIALVHTLLVSIYHMIKKKEPYKELGVNYLENLYKDKMVKNLKKRIESVMLSS